MRKLRGRKAVGMKARIFTLIQAINAVAGALPPPGRRTCPLEKAYGHYAAGEKAAPRDVPSRFSAPRDGFVVRPGSLSGEYDISAFHPVDSPCDLPPAGATCRVEEGTPVNPECLFVPVSKACLVGTGRVRLEDPAAGILREPGSFIRKGTLIVPQGGLVTERVWALLAASGVTALEVVDSPTVHVAAVGSELTAETETSGRFLVRFFRSLHLPVVFSGVVADEEEEIRREILNTMPGGLLIFCGGTGRGLTDLTINALRGEKVRFRCEGVRLRPGEGTVIVVGMGGVCVAVPGAPEAAAAAAYALLAPAAARWLGISAGEWPAGGRLPLAVPFRDASDSHLVLAGEVREGKIFLTPEGGKGGLLGAESVIMVPPGEKPRREAVVLAGSTGRGGGPS